MTPTVGQKEIETQKRIVKLFKDKLGYSYLGDLEDKPNNSNIEVEPLIKFLKKKKYSEILIKKAIEKLQKASNVQNKSLYEANKEVYTLLRYGADIKENVGEHKKTVHYIDWNNRLNNDFYIAQEVTITGKHDKRPDIVLYVNGIAVAVLELKRSTISVAQGIRQNLDNQKEIFIKPFFSTIQLVMAGNDTEGLRYATIETPEKYYLSWKEKSTVKNKIDRVLLQLGDKERLLEIIHDFIVFDSGTKKICRHNQYFGVRESQKYLKKRKGGIIWHTQGSGKSLTMIWLAKWIRENIPNSRVLIITDRQELDDQIERFFKGVKEDIYRTKSGKDLIKKLNTTEPWLMCSLVHKFGRKTSIDVDDFLAELKDSMPKDFKAKGDIYVFVDECHRTQSGKLHKAMTTILPKGVFVGFTGTPLLKADKRNSIKTFGKYIHTYKYDEAVNDKVVLDLQYEAREINQRLSSPEKVDQWFEAKTKGLTDVAKRELKKRWGTMQKVLSSQSRLNKIVADILLDMEKNDRLLSGRGNAILVAGSIYEACKYYELFQGHGLKKCAIVTSYNPHVSSIKGETVSDEEETENIRKYEIYQKMLNGKDPDIFEKEVKKQFVEEPGQMKLLIVVDKLLTGFDAPPATYLYIDKNMQDHGLFQAICRVNRLDGEDKDYGYIIDYKDLFKSLNQAVKNYTSEAFDNFDVDDVEGLLKERIKTAKENLVTVLEKIRALCESVKPPKESSDFIEYFCGNTENSQDLRDHEPRRVTLYKLTSTLIRAYVSLAGDMEQAGFTKKEALKIKDEVQYFEKVRSEIKLASGDYIDLKAYEPAMRHLIDAYIDADESKTISAFDDLTIIDLIVKEGENAVDKLPSQVKKDRESVAQVIENNVRKLIIDETPSNPKYYEKMSILLDAIIKERKENAKHYELYLKKIVAFIKSIKSSQGVNKYPKSIKTPAMRAFYDNLDQDEKLSITLFEFILKNKPDGWKGHTLKERKMIKVIQNALEKCNIAEKYDVDEILELVRNQDEF